MPAKNIELQQVTINDEDFYKITHHDQMAPFFMSIVSDGNHWMFISSNGGLTAGRKNSNFALFPYYTDDKLTELAETTGSKSIFRIEMNGESKLWEPFSIRSEGIYQTSRNIYKNLYGNKLMFEEVNHELGLTFRYQWSSSNQYGFVRDSYLINESNESRQVELIDGVQNILPYGVAEELQGIRSNLVDAYKRSELDAESGVGLFALSAIIVDRAEPSEALKCNVAWSYGLNQPTYLISSDQLDAFRKGLPVTQEEDIKARKGAYFVSDRMVLEADQQKNWIIVANVNHGPSDVVSLIETVKASDHDLYDLVREDVNAGTEKLKHLVSGADGFQLTSDDRVNARHYSNTLFNIMRGGIFDHNYEIEKNDFINYLKKANQEIASRNKEMIEGLSQSFTYQELMVEVASIDDPDLKRLAIEYLPLKFSRRHGDPSRPWNRFSINTRSEVDGSKILDYEGNWRDIFQNWEALAHAYPDFIEGMIFKFLNASTFDGYNPYRVTKDGFDWEVIEEHDPWSYIGYWGDHQIIYLLKFLEFVQDHFPGKLNQYFDQELFVYANVPYKIKPYDQILDNPKDTIIFDYQLDVDIRKKREQLGADGALITNAKGNLHRVNFMEKVLATTLAKLSNFIPEGGIWLNTQRPEWNDANNALVGNGVSMVTLYYLRRFFDFFKNVLEQNKSSQRYTVSAEMLEFFNGIKRTLTTHVQSLSGSVSDQTRKTILDGLGQAGSDFREKVYQGTFSGDKSELTANELAAFVDLVLKYLEHSIRANQRTDDMYHAYNLMTVSNDHEVAINHLDVMLEGQVAVLSSGYLSPEQSLKLLDAMKTSPLFRADQYSYLLYPNKELPRFLVKNIIPEQSVKKSELLQLLRKDDNRQIIELDTNGQYHFNGNFNNAESLKQALKALPGKYQEWVKVDEKLVLSIFEEVFNHKAFTGRSGTFFGYEGLGSIYWHMVSKLGLAVEECCLSADKKGESAEVTGKLMEHFYEINAGIGVHKSPDLYGAFPIDPYSHTPQSKGAQQPGMTGQVKEDIISRIGELGVKVKQGSIHFDPVLLRKTEFLTKPSEFSFIDLSDHHQSLMIQEKQLVFTLCQVPVVYEIADHGKMKVTWTDGSNSTLDKLNLDQKISQKIFSRSGEIEHIKVYIPESKLK